MPTVTQTATVHAPKMSSTALTSDRRRRDVPGEVPVSVGSSSDISPCSTGHYVAIMSAMWTSFIWPWDIKRRYCCRAEMMSCQTDWVAYSLLLEGHHVCTVHAFLLITLEGMHSQAGMFMEPAGVLEVRWPRAASTEPVHHDAALPTSVLNCFAR